MDSVSVIIVAGGLGTRFGGARPKQLALLAGEPLLLRTVRSFLQIDEIYEIILVLPEDWQRVIEEEVVAPLTSPKIRTTSGGETRSQSTRRGLALAGGGLVLVHDGARPLVMAEDIQLLLSEVRRSGAAILAAPVNDTLKSAENGVITGTVDREKMWLAQTPQGFRRELLERALADSAGQATDEAALVEALGYPVALVRPRHPNIKVTTPEDLILAEALLRAGRPEQIRSGPRVGQGYDVHRLVSGRPLFLGCLEIPFEKGLLGHSDADVLAHALVDALLGAAGLGDIGRIFPDSDPRWAGVSGKDILAQTMLLVRSGGWELAWADLTLIGERPKIAPYREAMTNALAEALSVSPASLNLKATTTEGLGALGRQEGLGALAVACLN